MKAKQMRLALLGLIAMLLGAPPTLPLTAAAAPPEPNLVPTRWQLDLEVGPMRVITLSVPEVGRRSYYYVTYTVTNNSGEDVFFAPMFELATDRGEMIPAGQDVPRWVSEELLRRLEHPFLEDQIDVIGQIQQGEEYAKDGLVIWPVGEENIDELTAHFIGFSGESRTVQTRDARTGEIREVVLRKTYMKPFRAPGHLLNHRARSEGGRRLIPERGRWIMRQPGTIIADDVKRESEGTGNAGGRDSGSDR